MSEGFVKLVNKFEGNGDIIVVNAAKQSYGRESGMIGPKEQQILHFMMEKRHGTPFEAYVMQFQVQCTIREAREWFRHRWGSFNEYSTRFSKLIEDWYVPHGMAIRTGSSANGGSPQIITDPKQRAAIVDAFRDAYDDSNMHYRRLKELGASQELASYVYTLGNATQFVWTVNLRALCNFLSLRMEGAALLELRQKAYKVYGLAEPLAPHTFQMWTQHRQPDMVTDWHDDESIDIPEELLD